VQTEEQKEEKKRTPLQALRRSGLIWNVGWGATLISILGENRQGFAPRGNCGKVSEDERRK